MNEPVYLLDTDTVSNYLDKRRQHPLLHDRILNTSPAQLCISIITVEEMLRGALDVVRQAQTNRRSVPPAYAFLQELFEALHTFSIQPYTEEADRLYQGLPPEVKRVGKNDCRIAATALAAGCVVITTNVGHFARILDLHIEDWTREES